MATVERIDVEAARREIAESRATFVCAYDDRQKCGKMRLEGAIDMHELRAVLDALPKNRQIILYCA